METTQERAVLVALRLHTGENSSGNLHEDVAAMMRDKLKELEFLARDFIECIKTDSTTWNKWESIAQATIAMRHLEDARMRYWKVIQYLNDWVNIYDKEQSK